MPVQVHLENIFCATEAGAPANLPRCQANPLSELWFLCCMMCVLWFSPTCTHKAVAEKKDTAQKNWDSALPLENFSVFNYSQTMGCVTLPSKPFSQRR